MNVLRWFISFIGAQLLCGVVWFVGPLVPPLEGILARAATVAGLAVAWAIGNLALDLRRLSRERSLVAGVAGGKPEDAEAAALQEKLAAALAALRKARGRRGSLYEQPWYVIIGPPGAGKTTALLNAGLEFPLAEQMGRGALAGVGGTRLCEWWFTDKAVLIDTAGRYTTQDSDAAVDKAGWDTFLRLLKRTRPKQPLNGVIVAIALNDVVGESGPGGVDRMAHARAIRRRIAELEDRLGVRIPVYALFTKSDLLSGFTEFFDDLDREGREQVWGVTFPYKRGGVPDALAAFGAEFKRWVGVLEQRMFPRLQGEKGPERRALVSAFPAQFATVGAPVGEFLREAFVPGARDGAPMLRGVYFTSATQEGTPMDRLTGAIARAFGLDSRQTQRLRPEEGRTFFLTGLLRDVIFREAMLVSASPGARRRALLLRSAGFAACLLLALAGGGLLWWQQGKAAAQIEAAGAALAGYESDAKGYPLDPVRDGDLPRLVPLLDRARALPFGHEDKGEAEDARLGLSQAEKLGAAAKAVYRHGLEYALFPRLIWRLEAQMRGSVGDPEFEYEATRIYLMLGGQGRLDRDLVREWMKLDWQETYKGEAKAGLRERLGRHLDALLDNPLPPVALDGPLVAAARATFGRVSVAQRIYSRIKPSAAAAALKPWRPSDALGPAGAAVFVRSSGKPLTEGIAGFFTPAGFHTVLLPALSRALHDVAAESWVVGEKTDLGADSPAMRAAERETIQLYTTDYIRAWDGMLADLEVAPLRSLVQAAQDLFILGSPQYSVLKSLLASIAKEVTLAPAGDGGQASARAENDRLGALRSRLTATETSGPAPGQAVDDHFKALREVMRPGQLDQALKPLVDLQQQLARMAASARGTAAPEAGGADPAVALQAEALRQPAPLRGWLASIAASGRALRGGGVKEQMVASFKAAGGPGAVCAAVVNGKYPFSPNASADVSLEDFARLFAPGGVLDAFYNTNLKAYVDTTAHPAKLQPVEGILPPIGPADLQQFQRAMTIRDLFFGGGGRTPKVRFDLIPVAAAPAGSTATVDLGSATLSIGGGPPRPVQIVWPPPKPAGVGVSWTPPGGPGLEESGPWALFRLFGRGRLVPGGGDRATLVLRDADRSATLEVRAAPNPFTTTVLQDFRCPTLQ